ncbi:MAG: RHS repeat-associated core domain-containing protein, partial [Acetivibrio ethanolgignens]
GTEEYHYNRKNQLICRFSEKEKTAYRYDRQGNLLEAAGAEGTTVFSYNVFHQQTAVNMPDGKRLENQYDAEYLRAGTVENGTVTTFSYHNGELLAESSPDGDTISRYIPGYGVAAGWNREKSGYHYYHLDEQNSTAYITGSSGGIENQYEYDAFGVIKNSREELPNKILYTGQQYDQESGQYYLRARFYNPVLGRFVQEDVYRGDGLNLYAYCKNNPVVYYDPSGYKAKTNLLCKEETGEGGNGTGEYGSKASYGKSSGKQKTGPKPQGTGAHNLKIEEIASQVTDGTVIAGGGRICPNPEVIIQTPNGLKKTRRPDILVQRPDGTLYGLNVGKTTAKGAPIKREVEALYDLEDHGLPMYFVGYDK